MIIVTGLKNKFMSLSKPARYIYAGAIIAFVLLTLKIFSAFVTPVKVEKKEEVSNKVEGASSIALQAGRSTTDVRKEQSDRLLDLAREVDTEKSENDFATKGIGTENVELANWEDESKLVSAKEKAVTDSKTQGDMPNYILRDPKSDRITGASANIDYEISSEQTRIKHSTNAQKKSNKEYVNMDAEATALLINTMVTELKNVNASPNPSVAVGESYVKANIEAYNWEVNKVLPNEVSAKIHEQKLSRYMALQAKVESNQRQGRAGLSSSDISNQLAANEGGDKENADLGRGLLPGDILPCSLMFSINSDLSSVAACEVVRGPLRGAIIGLNVQRQEEYVTLTSSGITFNDYYDAINGIAISMEQLGTTGIRSDIDRHTLSRWSALLFAGAFDGVWELYKTPRQRTVLTDNGIIQTTEEPSDRQVLLAALSRPASILSKSAEAHFDRPNTVYVHRGELVGVYIQQPFNKEWLPDVSKNANQIKY